jgi:hypothetical protein
MEAPAELRKGGTGVATHTYAIQPANMQVTSPHILESHYYCELLPIEIVRVHKHIFSFSHTHTRTDAFMTFDPTHRRQDVETEIVM